MSMPRYAQDSLYGSGGGGNPFNGQNLMGGLGALFGGMMGNSGEPYQDAMDQYQKYFGQAAKFQNPFMKAGTDAIPGFQNWLGTMKDPSGFINNLMSNYKQSPWAKYQLQNATRAATNVGSASGLTGSTPMMQQAQQNAANISSGDMNNWLGNVLGVNSQYGQGEQSLINTGANSANALTNLYGNFGQNMGEAAYGKAAGENQDESNMWGGLFQLAGMFL